MTFAGAIMHISEVDPVNRPIDPKLREKIKQIRLRDIEVQIRSILEHGGYRETEINAIVSAAISLLRNNEQVSPQSLYLRMRDNGVAEDDARMMSNDFAY